MSEIQKIKCGVKTFETIAVCPECGKGELIDMYGLKHAVPDPTYIHKCNECDHIVSIAGSYPHLSYERTNEVIKEKVAPPKVLKKKVKR